MKSIISALLWISGALFFSFVALFFLLAVHLLPVPVVYQFMRVLFRIQVFMMGMWIKVSGLDYFDHKKSYIVMGNHESLFDAFVIPVAIPMPIVAVEAEEHFSMPVWGYLIRKWGQVPIHRYDLEKAKQDLGIAKEKIASGTSILILPEGHRTMTGKIREFKKGPFHLAQATKTDILPFALVGLYEYKSKHSWKIQPSIVQVNIGKPIAYETFQNDSVEELREKVRNKIIELKGKE